MSTRILEGTSNLAPTSATMPLTRTALKVPWIIAKTMYLTVDFLCCALLVFGSGETNLQVSGVRDQI